ncbi:MAG: cytochrome c3 family protein [Thermodesulfobacteriota bacterium]
MKDTLITLAICIFLTTNPVYAGTYLDSAHGNTSYGVNRSSTSGYTKGNCGHCHEIHARIEGSEPAPAGGSPSKFTLFYTSHTSQTDSFCFKCHDYTTTVAATAIMNRNYSFRGGGWTADTLNDILEAFSNPPSISSHNLDDIKTFTTGRWGYTTDSNPCCACHNPHSAQGDPANSGSAAKSAATRGYPVSRPTQHATLATWGLWGDEAGEKMSDYTASYQAPYRFGSTTTYEPDGSSTTNGSNLTDFNTFCTDCHNATNTIYSTALGRNLKTIDWDNEKHGKGNADEAVSLNNPYNATLGKVLACTDCHEPHGSAHKVLIRNEVNGGTLGGVINTITSTDCTPSYSDTNKEIAYLCDRCHNDDYEFSTSCQQDHYYYIHHSSSATDEPYNDMGCDSCHTSGMGSGCTSTRSAINCNCCHYHGSVVSSGIDYAPTTRRTF